MYIYVYILLSYPGGGNMDEESMNDINIKLIRAIIEINELKVYVYIHIYIHIFVYTYIYVYIYVCIYINIYIYIHIYIGIVESLKMSSPPSLHICICIYTYIYIYVNIKTNTSSYHRV
jgi:hypothetical protein